MKHRKVSFLVFFLTHLFISVVAQNTPETSGSDLLPDINPQDIEIKGDYRIRFPGLQRQPILGFDPRPRVYLLDPNRIPFLETSDEVVASIPISPLEIPKSPVRRKTKVIKPSNLWLLGGFGLHNTPEAELGFQVIDKRKYRLSGFFSHISSSDLGFNVPSDFQKWNGNVAYTKILESGFNWTTRLTGGINKNQAPTSTTTTEFQDVKDWGVLTGLKRVNNPWDFWEVNFGYNGFQQGLGAKVSAEPEHVFKAKIENFWALDTPRSGMGIGADGTFSTYSRFGLAENYAIAHTYFRYNYRVDSSRKITLGIDPYFSKDENATRLFIFPTALIDYYGFNGSIIRAGVFGEVQNAGRLGYYQTSPFLNYSQRLLNNRGWVMFLNFELEFMERSSIYAGFDLKRYSNFGYINYVADSGNPALFSHNILYNEAQIVKLKGGYSYRFDAPNLSFNAEAWFLNHQLKGGNPIPYMERFGIKTDVLWFIQKQWYVQPEFVLLAGRKGTNTSANILLVNAKTRYSFNKHWAVYLKANNLTGADYRYWSDFQEWPIFLTGGLNLTF